MILDKLTQFADALALNTGAPGNYLLGDVIDLGISARDPGNGEPLWWYVYMSTAATSGGAATLQMQLLQSAAAGMTSPDILLQTDAIALASLVAGAKVARIRLGMVPTNITPKRYLGIRQVTGTAAFTGGALRSGLTKDVEGWTSLPDAVN